MSAASLPAPAHWPRVWRYSSSHRSFASVICVFELVQHHDSFWNSLPNDPLLLGGDGNTIFIKKRNQCMCVRILPEFATQHPPLSSLWHQLPLCLHPSLQSACSAPLTHTHTLHQPRHPDSRGFANQQISFYSYMALHILQGSCTRQLFDMMNIVKHHLHV